MRKLEGRLCVGNVQFKAEVGSKAISATVFGGPAATIVLKGVGFLLVLLSINEWDNRNNEYFVERSPCPIADSWLRIFFLFAICDALT